MSKFHFGAVAVLLAFSLSTQAAEARPEGSTKPCDPQYHKADTLVISMGDYAVLSGKMFFTFSASGSSQQPMGPEVVYVFRKLTEAEKKKIDDAHLGVAEGKAYVWRQHEQPIDMDLEHLKELKYLCDVNPSLSNQELGAVFLASKGTN